MKQILLTVLLSVPFISYPFTHLYAADSAADLKHARTVSGTQIKPGTIVKFGRYFNSAENTGAQAAVSSESSSGRAEKKPIEWKVLETEHDGTLLLVSAFSLNGRVFNEKRSGGTWEQSSIRKWLNTEFLQQAFNEKERKAISVTRLKNSRLFLFFSKAQPDTEDSVFLLSVEEVKKYFRTAERTAPATGYAAEHLCRNLFGDGGRWWLRTSGFMPGRVCYVDTDGLVFFAGGPVNEGGGCVRPAIRINPSGLNISGTPDYSTMK